MRGSDQTNTGDGGELFFGEPQRDEHSPFIAFDKKGCLAMARAAKHQNGSQFFVTLRPLPELNHTHTIFGRLVGGADVLDKINRDVKCDAAKRPLKNVKLLTVNVLSDPFETARAKLAELESGGKLKESSDNSKASQETVPKTVRDGVGKYLG